MPGMRVHELAKATRSKLLFVLLSLHTMQVR